MKKKAIAVTSLAVGVCMLATAAFANYTTSNGYDALKKALLGTLKLDNYTMNLKANVSVGDENLLSMQANEQFDKENQLAYSTSTTAAFGEETTYEFYGSKDGYFNSYNGEELRGYLNPDGENYITGSFPTINEEDETEAKVLRFVELICDTFVGDLKNNIVYIGIEDENSIYEMNLSSIQIPEVVNAGLSAMCTAQIKASAEYRVNGEEYVSEEDRLMEVLGTDPVIKSVSMRFSIDSEGRLVNISESTEIAGDNQTLTIGGELSMSDYGTTQPKTLTDEQKKEANDRFAADLQYSEEEYMYED